MSTFHRTIWVAGSGRKNAVALPYYAYIDVAMYDAVSAIDRRFQPFAVRVEAPRGASEDAAAASAAHHVLVHYLPSRVSARQKLQELCLRKPWVVHVGAPSHKWRGCESVIYTEHRKQTMEEAINGLHRCRCASRLWTISRRVGLPRAPT